MSKVYCVYTFLFESKPNKFISYPVLKEKAAVADTWQTADYGTVKFISGSGSSTTTEYGDAKAVFTIMTKNTVAYTIGFKTYSNVINVKRDIMFRPTNGSYRLLLSGNSYYARDYGLIDQVIGSSPGQQSVSLFQTPTIK